MKKRARHFKETKIEIIPMIDTMFFLLVFFLLSSLNIITLSGSKVNLPKALSAEQPKNKADLTVTIDFNRQTHVTTAVIDNTAFEPKNIGDALVSAGQRSGLFPNTTDGKVIEEKARDLTVVINADADVDNASVVQAIDSARAKGFVKFGIAAKGRVGLAQEAAGAAQ